MRNQLFIKTTAIATFVASIGLLTITPASKAGSDFSNSHTQKNSSSIQRSQNSTSVHHSGRSSSRSSYSSETNNSTFNISLPKKTSTENSEDSQQQPDATKTTNHGNSFGNTFDAVDEYIRRQLNN